MPSLQTLIDYALQQALTGIDQLKSALLDADMTMESLLGSVFQQVALTYANSDSDAQSLLRRTHTVTLTDGVGTLPDEALTSTIWGSTVNVPDETDIGPLMSYTPWASFVQPASDLLGYYSVRGDHEFYWIDPGDSYPSASGRDGDVEITIASVPEMPAAAPDPLDGPADVFSDLVTALANAIRVLVMQKAA